MPLARRGDSGPLRVLAWPGRQARAKNPYTWLLYTHLADLGVQVTDFTFGRALRGGYDVLHLHWPEKPMVGNSAFARLAGAAGGRVVLEAARLHGASVVWTTHNARPHEGRNSLLERWYWAGVMRRVNGLLHPSAASQTAVETTVSDGGPAAPRRGAAWATSAASYPDQVSREEARADLGLPDGAVVVDLSRPAPAATRTCRTSSGPCVRSRRSGTRFCWWAAGPSSRRSRRRSSARPARIRACGSPWGGFPTKTCSATSAPPISSCSRSRDITNSGSALLALSFDRPVLVPRLGAMGELQALLGPDWVHTYEGDLTPAILDEGIAWARRPRPARADLSSLEWGAIAEQTLAFYRAVRRGAGGVVGAAAPNS